MGSSRRRLTPPDLFSTASARAPSPPSITSPTADGGAAAALPSYALPTNLPSAIKHLDDEQLERLLAAVIAERQARGGRKISVSNEPRRRKQIKEIAPPLAQGKLNAVRAAFKAGVTPSLIARQFGVSLSDVRKALAADEKK